jgi:hypothetical protein
MPEIQTLGETSFIFLIRNFLMLWIKTRFHDFRVQSLYGGKYTLLEPSAELIQKHKKWSILFKRMLYAIVDGIVIEDDGNRMHWTWFVF